MVAPDGSPVEVYLRLRAHGEEGMVDDAVPRGGSILELGCGVGRITQALVARGRTVVAVDESAEMLAHVRGAETVAARIEDLDLRRSFTGVVLASRLVNVADAELRRLRLATCARHVEQEGVVVIERWTEEQAARLRVEDPHTVDGVEIVARAIDRVGAKMRVELVHRVEAPRGEWVQRFVAEVLDDRAFFDALSEVGLRHERWLDRERAWSLAALESPRHAP